MLLVLMYHRVLNDDPAAADKFFKHLTLMAHNFPIVLPGDPLEKGRHSVCLTFDDAYFDFYHFVYPLLLKLKIKALLAVPVKYILDTTKVDPHVRLNVPYYQTTEDSVYKTEVPFCTWQEIQEMAASNQVMIGSHSHSHPDMTKAGINLGREVITSKQVIENNIGRPISTFIYPFGKVNRALNRKVKESYLYSMRVGSSLNLSWHNPSGMIYRIDADAFWLNNRLWKRKHDFKYGLKLLSNIARFK